MNKKMTCILCPNGCKLKVQVSGDNTLSLTGGKCSKGMLFAEQEIKDPQRNIATSILVTKGDLPLVSVRLTDSISKDKILDVVAAIKKMSVHAPVISGQVLIENVLGLGVDVISTKNIKRIS